MRVSWLGLGCCWASFYLGQGMWGILRLFDVCVSWVFGLLKGAFWVFLGLCVIVCVWLLVPMLWHQEGVTFHHGVFNIWTRRSYLFVFCNGNIWKSIMAVHYKENTKKWLGFMINIGKIVHWWLATFLVLNLVMSDQSLQTKWIWLYQTIIIPHIAFSMRFWGLVLDRLLTLRYFSLYLVITMWQYLVMCNPIFWL